MIWYLLIATIINVGCACSVAVILQRRRVLRSTLGGARPPHEAGGNGIDRSRSSSAPGNKTLPVSPADIAKSQPRSASTSATNRVPDHREEVPQAWLEMLGDVLHTGCLAEAASHVVRMDVTHFREELLRIDDALRQEPNAIRPDILAALQTDLLRAVQDWSARQADALSRLQLHRRMLPMIDEPAARLEAALLDQSAHLRDFCSTTPVITDNSTGRSRTLRQIEQLVDQCHVLRDRTNESLISVLHQQQRLDTLKPELQIDSLTQLRSRAALEMMLESWWRDDPRRQRLASVALIDIDRMSQVNRALGPRIADRLIVAIANLACDTFRRNRGYDVVSRFSGQQLFVFLGDTGPHGATTAIERFRQTVLAAQLTADARAWNASVSCGIVEVLPDETMTSLYQRARATMLAAKAAGGNQSYLHDGTRAAAVVPPVFRVTLHSVDLDGGRS